MKYLIILLLFTCLGGNVSAQNSSSIRKIKADLQQVKGNKPSIINACIGAGRANEGLRADWQQQLALVQKEIGFKYIRFHGLLHDDMRVYTEDKAGNPVYNWQYVDKLFDYLLSIRIKPFVEFGFMPNDLASGTKTVFWWKANVTKPKSYDKWDSLITKLVSHWKERYGEKEVSSWYFEVWNEPDLKGFFDATQADYFELYNHTVKAVKSVSPNYRVGGPATSATKWIPEFIAYCDSARVPVDFFSTHDYGTTSVLDEFGVRKHLLKVKNDTIALNVKKVRNIIDASPFKQAELHFTEWNTSPSSRDPLHDSYQTASYILNTVKKTGTFADGMSYWAFTDIFEEAGPGLTPFHGGFGILNLQSIRKPAFYAYKFMSELGETELKNADSSSYVCISKNNTVQALIWNYNFSNMGAAFNQDHFSKLQPSSVQETAELEISNIKNGKYRVEVYGVGYKQNDPFTYYLEMGKPSQITRQQEADLKKQSTGSPLNTETVLISNGRFKKSFHLRDNDVVFVKLIKLDK